MNQKRLLLVHAHPDDETINNAITIAKYLLEGVAVTLVTCTQGELGGGAEQNLHADISAPSLTFGELRMQELRDAMEILGLTDYRLLKSKQGFGWSDSGTLGISKTENFSNVDVEIPSNCLAEILCEVKPQVIVTYDSNGGYGHPDHKQAHVITLEAARIARSATQNPWAVSKIYASVYPRKIMERNLNYIVSKFPYLIDTAKIEYSQFTVNDNLVTTRIYDETLVDLKIQALSKYPSQIHPNQELFSSADPNIVRMWASEYFSLLQGVSPVELGNSGFEEDLFANIEARST
jgi:N-acetyl-1-D-myo-inositol-2-amino-2-deoxy-alpha-D-glucopyranoside deacetylase